MGVASEHGQQTSNVLPLQDEPRSFWLAQCSAFASSKFLLFPCFLMFKLQASALISQVSPLNNVFLVKIQHWPITMTLVLLFFSFLYTTFSFAAPTNKQGIAFSLLFSLKCCLNLVGELWIRDLKDYVCTAGWVISAHVLGTAGSWLYHCWSSAQTTSQSTRPSGTSLGNGHVKCSNNSSYRLDTVSLLPITDNKPIRRNESASNHGSDDGVNSAAMVALVHHSKKHRIIEL